MVDKANINPKTIFTGDCLPIMRGMNSESIDLIYLDPPFNSNVDYAAPIGSKAAGSAFKDTWTLADIDLAWLDLIETSYTSVHRVIEATMKNSDKSYLIYMAVRLLEMYRILKPTGQLYLHCDPTMSHYLKLLLDAIWGKEHYRNEIIWCYSRPSAPGQRQLSRVHDVIHWYSQGDEWTFNPDLIRQPYAERSRNREGYAAKKSKMAVGSVKLNERGKFPESWIYIPPVKGNSDEYVGYPTQKPLALLERIIKASSNKGDLIFDPFCGCATTLIAADRLGRDWIGIDLSPKASELVVTRMKADQKPMFSNITVRTDIPKRTDLGKIPKANSRENKTLLYGRQEGNCNGCSHHFEARNLEIDHIIARAQGGSDHIDNLQLLCGNCNRVKGARGQEYLIAKLQGRKITYPHIA